MWGEFLKRGGKLLAFFLIIMVISFLFIPSFSQKKVLVKIPKGAGSKEISFILWKNKIIPEPFLFLFLTKVLNCEDRLKAGVYEFESPNLVSVLNKLREGKVKICRITLPEGLPKWEVAELLSKKGIVDKKEFLEVVDNPECFYKNFPWLSGEKSLEGYLFPDTYYFALEDDPVKVAGDFLARFEQEILPLYRIYEKNTREKRLSLHQIVTLASIVEKEAKVNFEKPVIAGVFYNRLRRGMKLRADPTIKYALGSFSIRLYKKILDYPSAYNTYLYSGLPPGPICSPGVESIKATISPAKIGYLYFVAKGDGTHEFSNTYRDHLKAIEKYRRG